jgi:hypothetical protein
MNRITSRASASSSTIRMRRPARLVPAGGSVVTAAGGPSAGGRAAAAIGRHTVKLAPRPSPSLATETLPP